MTMPELPEVETIRRGLSEAILDKAIEGAVVRRSDLRRPVADSFAGQVLGKVVTTIDRRGKYLLLNLIPMLLRGFREIRILK